MQLHTHYGSHDNFTCMYCMHTYPLIQCTYTSNGGITCTVHVLIPIYTPCVRVSMYTIVTVVLLVPYMYSYPYIPLVSEYPCIL